MRRLISTTAAVIAALIWLTVPALAQTLPPGNSGVDQYTENVPGAAGDKPSNNGGGGGAGGGGGGGAALPPQSKAALDQLGKEGAAAAKAAEASGPTGGGPTQQTGGDAPGSDGFSLLLPLFLIVTLLGAGAVILARSRRHGQAAG